MTASIRWLLVVLMVLLPAQFSWAAAAPYCAHEGDPTSFHIGHHAHVHQGSPAGAPAADPRSDEAPSGSLVVSDHDDCHYCHGAACHLASHAAPRLAPAARQAHRGLAAVPLEDARAPSIERPKWTRAA